MADDESSNGQSNEQSTEHATKVLIGCVTYDKHAFVLDAFLDALKQQTFNDVDILFVDNSETEEYATLLRKKGIHVLRDPPGDKNRIQRIVSGRAKIRETFLKGSWEYLFFVDTDILIPRDTLEHLLAQDKDIISGVCLCRMNINGKMEIHPALYDFAGEGKARLMTVQEMMDDSVKRIDVCGFGCCLIRRAVMEKVPLRYYEQRQSGEDVAFNVDAHKLGFKTFVDKSVKCKHVTPAETLEVAKK